MKIIIFLSLFIFNNLVAQLDTANWYPLEIGNKWQFSYGLDPVYYYSKEVIGDTLMPNGKVYSIVAEGSNTRYERNHNNHFVYSYDFSDTSEILIYDFISEDGTIWEQPYSQFYRGIVKTENEFNYSLNKNTYSKIYDWVSIDSSNNSIDTLWSAWIDVWAVKVTKGLGISTDLYAAIINGDTIGTITSVSKKSELFNNYFLFQNYPNPFNPSTEIKFILHENTYAEVSIYNSIGQKVEILLEGYLTKGSYKLKFNGTKMSSGIYFYMLKTNNHKLVKKMLLLK